MSEKTSRLYNLGVFFLHKKLDWTVNK